MEMIEMVDFMQELEDRVSALEMLYYLTYEEKDIRSLCSLNVAYTAVLNDLKKLISELKGEKNNDRFKNNR